MANSPLVVLAADETEGDSLELGGGAYIAVVTDIGSATVTLQLYSNEQWVDTDLEFSSGDALPKVWAGSANFRARFITDQAGPVVEIGLMDQHGYGRRL